MMMIRSASALALFLAAACAGNDTNDRTYNPGNSTPQGDPGAGDSDTGTGDSETSGHDCAAMCAELFACDDVPDRDSLWATETDCLATCDGAGPPVDMAQCLAHADDCTGIADCVRCLEWGDDLAFCRDSACDFLVNDCGFGSDESQCTIDCEMLAGGVNGCFRGAGKHCWETAAAAGDCAAKDPCPAIYLP